MCGTDSLIHVVLHYSMWVAGEISAQNIGVKSLGEFAAELLHSNRGLGVTLGPAEMHAFPKNGDVRISRF